jgi:hypothetical protein
MVIPTPTDPTGLYGAHKAGLGAGGATGDYFLQPVLT